MSPSVRWRWHLLALVPGVLSVVVFVALLLVSLNAPNNPEWVADIWMVVLWVLIGSPLAVPFYTYLIGRSYVRANYPGLKSAMPFAVMYSAANFALWLGGVIFVGVMGKPFP
jgi:hypothetical protein